LASIVVVNGWVAPDPHFLRCFEARLALLRHAGPEAFLRAQPIFLYPAPWISQNHSALETEREHQLAAFPGEATMEKRIAALAAFDISERLDQITTPILAYASRDDMLVPFTCTTEGLSRAPDCQVELAPWGGHGCNITDPARFTGAVADFLSRHKIRGSYAGWRFRPHQQQWLADQRERTAISALLRSEQADRRISGKARARFPALDDQIARVRGQDAVLGIWPGKLHPDGRIGGSDGKNKNLRHLPHADHPARLCRAHVQHGGFDQPRPLWPQPHHRVAAPEYTQMGLWPGDEHFRSRYKVLDEYAHILRELWETGVSDFKGQYYTMDDCRVLPTPQADMKIICAGSSDEGLAFSAKWADYAFCLGKGVNTPTAFSFNNDRLAKALELTGRDVQIFVLMMVIAAETDEEAHAKWQSYNAGVDVDAISWLAEQGAKDTVNKDTNVRQLAAPEGAVNINMGTLVGSYASVARMLDEMAAVPNTGGVLLTFDDFVEGWRRSAPGSSL
jgi:hypothetical protein